MGEGLRERKKRHTREALHRAAVDLMAARGYDATTIADIAAAADVSRRTFFAYFASKQDAVFIDHDAALASFEGALARRGDDETTFTALRRWIQEEVPNFTRDGDHESRLAALIANEPVLAAKDREVIGHFEAAIHREVARDLDQPPEALVPRIVAAAMTAAIDTTATETNLYDETSENLDQVLIFLEGGLTALRHGSTQLT